MRRFLAVFLSMVCLFGSVVHAEEIEEPKELYAQAAVLMDAESGRVLFAKNKDKVMAMASTTKIMTCILALEKSNLDDVVTATELAAAQPKVHLGMQKGEQFILRDLLYSLMLESHNDSAVAIAEHVGGSVEGFAELMNAMAKELECDHTYFITPNGLDAQDANGIHSTTAEDLARIMSYCIMDSPKNTEFLSITSQSNYTFCNVEKSRQFVCNNHNAFLTMMDGAISGKTGFTGKAGYCYVGAVERDGRNFVVALLACGWPNNKNYKWKDTLKLMEYAVENYTYQFLEMPDNLPTVKVNCGIAQSNSLFEESKVEVQVDYGSDETPSFLLRKDEAVETELFLNEQITAPLDNGEVVGKIIYNLDGSKLKEYPIVVSETVKIKSMAWVFRKLVEMYCLN